MDKTPPNPRYLAGELYLFEEWDFGAGRGPQQKFSIILKHQQSTCLVLHCWPTKVDRSIEIFKSKSGCVNTSHYSCYKFKAGRRVTTEGWTFNRDTYVYCGSGLDINDSTTLDIHARYGKLRLVGKILPPIFQELINCLLTSADIPQRYRRFLEAE